MDANIPNKAWNTIFKVMSGITDPISRGGSKWIFAAFPYVGKETSPDLKYPIIVIEPFTTASSRPDTFGKTIFDNRLATTIEVHDNAGGSRFDALCGNVVNQFWSKAEDFAKSGMTMPFIGNGVYNHIFLSRDNKIHTRSYGVEFRTC